MIMASSSSPRHQARRLAVQAIYQWHYNEALPEDVINEFLSTPQEFDFDQTYFKALVLGVITHAASLDQTFGEFLSRDIKELTPVELAVLRLATYELQYCLDVPYKVVINEALELNKTFGTSEGYRFVNGVLDKLAKQLREIEKLS